MRGLRSLRTRWTLALMAVCVLEAALVAVAVRVSTSRAFGRFVVEESFEVFVADVESAVQRTGDLNAALSTLGTRPASGAEAPRAESPDGSLSPEAPLAGARRPDRPRGEGAPPARPGARPRGGGMRPPDLGRSIAFGLADAEGRVVRPFDGYASGDALALETLARGRAVIVGGEQVGTAFVPSGAAAGLADFPETSPEARFVRSSTTALVVALGVALAVALGVGVWLTGRTVRPLRRLTDAARGIASGELGRSVQVSRDDEVGALGEAFNTMSARLAESTALRQRMTSDVSHDLRTPVTAVLGTLELIESGALAPTPERIRTARLQAERLARLIESFHTLAIADAGELPVHPTRVPLAEALRHAALAFEAQTDAAEVEIAVEADAPDVRADPDRLAQILANLISNALRHTPPGGRVTLSAREAASGVEIAVRDTGRGIPAGVLPHIFERSVRADGSRSGEGAGLGLSIVRSLTDAMGGAVGAASAPEAGTTVTVTLPVWDGSPDSV
ncbi:sensor histidine kinase [Rubricoccus marinus]|uniref:histidine kinase n=1 Tax=Rubricoccus marinus TaxID=716817 RepID=A0A259U0R7_9BACT|nr:HAMP domain-containing sensor histidine kinase [Rubricoccus marinus]OZC03592.1 hypothetical protein BSZ36_11725 [Rubricoccus marinus]